QIVARSMILGEASESASLKQPNGKIESRRTILPFVVSIRHEVRDNRISPSVPQDLCHHSINARVSTSAPLVVRTATVTNTGDDQPMLHACDEVFVASEPGDSANGAGSEQEAIAIVRLTTRKQFGQVGQQRQAGTIVICQSRMADMR